MEIKGDRNVGRDGFVKLLRLVKGKKISDKREKKEREKGKKKKIEKNKRGKN